MTIPFLTWAAGAAIVALAATVFFWDAIADALAGSKNTKMISSRGVSISLIIWSRIVEDLQHFVLPILEKYAPSLAPFVADAFSILDDIASDIRLVAKRAWRKIRQYVIALYNDYFFRDGKVLQKTAMFTKTETKGKFKEHVTEREISRDDLPESVRESLLRDRNQPVRVDIRSIQDMIFTT